MGPSLKESVKARNSILEEFTRTGTITPKKKKKDEAVTLPKEDMKKEDFEMDTPIAPKPERYVSRYGAGKKKPMTAAERRHAAMNK